MKLKLLDTYEFDKIHRTLSFVLRFYGLKFTDFSIRRSIESHTDTSSLLSIKDILSDYGIKSTVIRKGNYDYENFETPFICLIQKEEWTEKNFTVVTKVNQNGEVHFLNVYQNRIETIPVSTFEKIDQKYILLMDGSDMVDEPNYQQNKADERSRTFFMLFPFVMVLLLSVITLFFRGNLASENSFQKSTYLITFYLGLIVSILLIWQEIDSHNPFFKKLCGGEREKTTDCDLVMASPGSKFLGFSWTVWGFSYFSTLFLVHLLFFSDTTTMLSSVISILATIYILYSIYYQFIVVKKWCRLCLVVQSILFVNFLVSMSVSYQLNSFIDWTFIGIVFGLGLVIVSLSSYTIKNLKEAKNGSLLEKKWKRLRYNETIFRALLQKEPEADPSHKDIGVKIGGSEHGTEIIKVCNLYCEPCAIANEEMSKLLTSNNQLRFRIVFNPSGNKNDKNLLLALYFMGIEDKYGPDVFHKALNEWFGSKIRNPNMIRTRYPIEEQVLSRYMSKVQSMVSFCGQMRINRTPTFIIDGHLLPEDYNFNDFKFLF